MSAPLAAAAVVTLLNSDETRQETKAAVTIFVGYIVTVFNGIVRGPGLTQ